MVTFADGSRISRPTFVSMSGCRTSVNGCSGNIVDKDWTPKSARILGKLPIQWVNKSRPVEIVRWSGDSKLNPSPRFPQPEAFAKLVDLIG